ncbi:hypothetical protein ACN28C_21010 [Plantactinospora sp. WMMC1484]|uniref:hypothetical protein n=1 Tax=Plantactinospora sp. WMMC1484 TaxID=3404122 RepID=UPI003BF54921
MVGTAAAVVGAAPAVVGAVPVVVGTVPPLVEGVPGLVRTVPDVVGDVAEVADAPHGEEPSLRMFVPPPVVAAVIPAATGPPMAPTPALGQDAAAPFLSAEPPAGFFAPSAQSFPSDAGGPAGGARAAARATLRSEPSGPTSVPYPPFDTGAGTNRAGPAASGGGQAVALPVTVSWQPPTRVPSLAPYEDVAPAGRTPGVPALPG